MGKHADFKDIVHGLASGFTCRNNDLDGYWAVGKLHALAQAAATTNLVLELWPSPSTGADSSDCEILRARWRDWIAMQLARHRLLTAQLRSARIELAFERHDLRAQAIRRGIVSAPPLLCTAQLVDDLGRTYHHAVLAMSRPHDPMRESRSTRATR